MTSPGFADGPAWPPDRWITPTALKQYGTCPRRVRLQYVDRRPEPPASNLFLTKGRIAHQILQQSARLIARRQPPLDPPALAEMASRRLHRSMFPSEEARQSELAEIVRWVRFGLEYLDRDAEYLLIERNATRPVALPSLPAPYTLMARPDLILLRTDQDGERFIEFIDYKTGKQRNDDVVPVLTRYVSRKLLSTVLPDPTTVRMRFTFLWLQDREADVIDLPLEYCEWSWESVTGVVAALVTERAWPEQPSHLCRYCPYMDNPCTAYERMALAGTTITSI